MLPRRSERSTTGDKLRPSSVVDRQPRSSYYLRSKSESGCLFAVVATAVGIAVPAVAGSGKAYSVPVVVGTSSQDDASPLMQPPPRGTAASLAIGVAGTAASPTTVVVAAAVAESNHRRCRWFAAS